MCLILAERLKFKSYVVQNFGALKTDEFLHTRMASMSSTLRATLLMPSSEMYLSTSFDDAIEMFLVESGPSADSRALSSFW